MDQLTETAFHEAGHAVIAWYVGAVLGSATILPDYDDGTAGRVLHGDSDAEPGDLGISFTMHPDHGLVAFLNETDGACRLVTADEREHVALVDEFGDTYSGWWQKHALICAAGEASASHAVELARCSPPAGYGSDDDRR